MGKHPWEWTKADLQAFIEQPESIRLEFKESKLWQSGQHFGKTLAKDISAFANTEGGTLIIGMRKKRSKPPIALELDEGLDPTRLSLAQLQYVVETSIRPPLPGLRCHAIPLSDEPHSRVAYVITVPQGNTAHQASDYIYYTRNEWLAVPMADHLVRALLRRGCLAKARLEIGNCEIRTKNQQDEYRFDLMVINTGEQTIADFLLAITITANPEELCLWAPTMFVDNEEIIKDELKSVEAMLAIGEDFEEHRKHEMLHGPGIPFQSGTTLRCGFRRIMQLLYQVDDKKIFPHDRLIFPGGKWLIEAVPHGVPLQHYDLRLAWTIYLDNAPPCSGEIELAQQF